MKKALCISFALTVFLFFAAGKSFACSCQASPDPLKKQIRGALSYSQAVFSGEVIEIKESTIDKYSVLVKFKVTQIWKGNFGQEITITTPKDSAMCGYNFETGRKYLVYANGSKENLLTTNCSRTSTFSSKGDAKYLDRLKRKKKILD